MSFTPSLVAHAAVNQSFAALQIILEKGAAHAKSRGIDEQVLLNWRLAPDMFTMSRQVQIACDQAARGFARLAGVEVPSFPDTEKSFEELKARVSKALAFIKDVDRAKVDADPDSDITFPVGKDTMTLKRRDYLVVYVLPNIYFHVTTAYANLRVCGVPIGKMDYLARPR